MSLTPEQAAALSAQLKAFEKDRVDDFVEAFEALQQVATTVLAELPNGSPASERIRAIITNVNGYAPSVNMLKSDYTVI